MCHLSWCVVILRSLFALGLMLAPMAVVLADSEQDRARDAVRAGEIAPLGQILEAVKRDFAGEVLDAELERDDGRWIYEIKLISPQGAVLKLKYDAKSRALIRAQGHGVDAARRAR
jgi:hypothetical protein